MNKGYKSLLGREVYFTMSKKDHARLKCFSFFTPKKLYTIVATSHSMVSIHCNPHSTDSQADKIKQQGVLVNIFLTPKTCNFLTVPACRATGAGIKTKGWTLVSLAATVTSNKGKGKRGKKRIKGELLSNKAAPRSCANLASLLSATPSLSKYEVTPKQRASGCNAEIGRGKESFSPSKLRAAGARRENALKARKAARAKQKNAEKLKARAKKLMVAPIVLGENS